MSPSTPVSLAATGRHNDLNDLLEHEGWVFGHDPMPGVGYDQLLRPRAHLQPALLPLNLAYGSWVGRIVAVVDRDDRDRDVSDLGTIVPGVVLYVEIIPALDVIGVVTAQLRDQLRRRVRVRGGHIEEHHAGDLVAVQSREARCDVAAAGSRHENIGHTLQALPYRFAQ